MTGLLEGVRVIDLADESALFAGRMLAELGADVIRVEPPGGDAVRRRPPFLDDEDRTSLYHLHFNAGKRGVALDDASAGGRAQLRRLVDGADILIVTETRRALAARGLDYPTLAASNPGLVHVSVTPFGPDGPMSEYRANDLVASAASGLMYLNGLPEDPPIVPGAEQAYHMASLAAVSAALVAMVGRRGSNGRGREVTVSIQEAAAMATLQTANANYYSWHRTVPRRQGLQGSGVRNLYPCADGKWVSFTIPVGTGPLWGNFVEWLDEREIAHEFTSPEWFDPAYRQPRAGAVAEAIARLCLSLPRDEVFHDGQRRRLLTMPVNDVADLVRDPQLRHRGFFRPLDHPWLGRSFEVPGAPYQFSGAAAGVTRPAPRLGEHNEEVLGGPSVDAPRAAGPAAGRGR